MTEERGVAVQAVVCELTFRNHLRKLAEQRERRTGIKNVKRKEACTGGAVQTSNANNAIKLYDNSSIVEEICQVGGGLSD